MLFFLLFFFLIYVRRRPHWLEFNGSRQRDIGFSWSAVFIVHVWRPAPGTLGGSEVGIFN